MPTPARQRLHDTTDTLLHTFGTFVCGIQPGVDEMERWARWLRLRGAAMAWMAAANRVEDDRDV